IGIEKQIEVDKLYTAYRAWCDENGHAKITKATFGRDLRAAIPSVKRVRPREGGGEGEDRVYVYLGIDLVGGNYIDPALGPLGLDRADQDVDGSGPRSPSNSAMYTAPSAVDGRDANSHSQTGSDIEVLGPASAGERCTLCGKGGPVKIKHR